MQLPKVSIIIPAYNEEKYLPSCLQALADLDYEKELVEIIVVDNGSTDRTVKIAKAFGCRIFVDGAKTVGGLRNLGASKSTGEILAFVDADCTVSPVWLMESSRYFDNLRVAAWGSPPEVPKNATWVQKTWLIVRQKRQQVQEVDWLESMNLFVRKEIFLNIDGFNDSLATCEDVDFCYRVGKIGSIISDNRIKSIHFGEASTVREFFRKEIWRGQSNLDGIESHGISTRELRSLAVPFYFMTIIVFALFSVRFLQSDLMIAFVLLCYFSPTLLFLGHMYYKKKRILAIDLLRLSFLVQVYFLARSLSVFKRT